MQPLPSLIVHVPCNICIPAADCQSSAPPQHAQSACQCTIGHIRLSGADHALVALGRYYLVWNWDNAIWGTSCLLAALQPGLVTRYSTGIEGFLASWINGNNGITVTPKGLAWLTEWGSLRNSANAGLLPCKVVVEFD